MPVAIDNGLHESLDPNDGVAILDQLFSLGGGVDALATLVEAVRYFYLREYWVTFYIAFCLRQ